MSITEANEGDAVLFVAPSTLDQDAFLKIKSTIQESIGSKGSTAFEAMERIADAPLKSSNFHKIYSNIVRPSTTTHMPNMLARFLSVLAPSGVLELHELVLLTELSNTVCPITRQESDLVSTLKLTGFVDISVTSVEPLSDEDTAAIIKLWGATRIDQGVARLSGKFGLARILAKKPAYEIGQITKLNFKKKTDQPTDKKAIWMAVAKDDEAELEDEDDLLDEEDKIKPSKESLTRPDDCELTDGKRKACKNCTCGRAEAEMSNNVVSLDLADDIADEIIEVDPTPKKTGGCGSCALGDAFRCSTCPYLGMPAFGDGDAIKLGGMFSMNDLDDL